MNNLNRRNFMKGLGALGLGSIIPSQLVAANSMDINSVVFNKSALEQKNAQTIILYLYGGASELAGNLSNLDDIARLSTNPYPLNQMTRTQNNFWEQAGGNVLERMLSNQDLNLYRTCHRTVDGSRDHGRCSTQAQCGSLDTSLGIVSTLASVLYENNALNIDPSIPKSTMPFVSLYGNSSFYLNDGVYIPNTYKPVTLNPDSNPYVRSGFNEKYILNSSDSYTLSNYLDRLSINNNPNGIMKDFFERREVLDNYIKDIQQIEVPDNISYPNTKFGKLMKNAVTIMLDNPYTKVLTMGTPCLGGWDDHSNALANYPRKMRDLMESLEVAIEHIKTSGKTNINIVVFSEFGRNVNYNDAKGWDHGNNQNVYWMGGWDYFKSQGIVGETEITGSGTRLFTTPKDDSYQFQVFSIAATLYKLYGIENPEVLTDNNLPIKDLII